MTPSPQARRIYADALNQRGPGWANAADSIRNGRWGNAFTDAALMAIEKALNSDREENDDEEEPGRDRQPEAVRARR